MVRFYFGLCVWGLVILAGCDSGPAPNGPQTTGSGGSDPSKVAARSAESPTKKTDPSTPDTSLSGSVKIEGSSTVGPISTKARELFNQKFPKVNVSVGEQGTSNGFASLIRKEVDIADASRPIKLAEFEKCQAAGISFLELPIAYDGLTFVVNKENTFCQQLTVDQLKKIFLEDRAVKSWNELDPSWPAEPLDIFAPGINSGTHEYCMEVLVGKEKINMRSDEQITLSEDDKQLVAGVVGEKYGIGFFGLSYYESSKDKLRAVPIVNGKGTAVEPSLATVENGTYEPFSRPLFIYVNATSFERLEVAEFTNFYLENVDRIVRQAQYVPLPANVNQQVTGIVESNSCGTRFLDETGAAVKGTLADLLNRTPVQSLKTGETK